MTIGALGNIATKKELTMKKTITIQKQAVKLLRELQERSMMTESALNNIPWFDPTCDPKDLTESEFIVVQCAMDEDQAADREFIAIQEVIDYLEDSIKLNK